jgi:precorrin-6A/cobalt-precorrin-6A reductase
MILVLGGTSESREVAALLAREGMPVLYSSTTNLIGDLPAAIERITGTLSRESLRALVEDRSVRCIVDATHPFAVEISRTAMAVARDTSMAYIRLERSSLEGLTNHSHVRRVDTLEEAALLACETSGAILSTLGTRMLGRLCDVLGERRDDLVTRVLPTTESLSVCEQLGIPVARIIAMRGPFPPPLELACIRHFGISAVLTKDSGERGGLRAKADACRAADCPLIVIARPPMSYPCACTTPEQCPRIVRDLARDHHDKRKHGFLNGDQTKENR